MSDMSDTKLGKLLRDYLMRPVDFRNFSTTHCKEFTVGEIDKELEKTRDHYFFLQNHRENCISISSEELDQESDLGREALHQLYLLREKRIFFERFGETW